MALEIYATKLQLANAFSDWLSAFIKEAENDVHIALSGGSTPKLIFEVLAASYREEIPWSRVHFYWGDERCVPPTDMDSNFGMTAELLLSKINIPSENVHRIKGEQPPEEEAIRYSELLSSNLKINNNFPSFDLVLLGMGDDGHTASIFPHQISLWDAESHCVVATHPESGQKRVSITGKVINKAQTVAFLITGANKAAKLAEIHNKTGDFNTYPAALVAPESGELIWFLDKEAAAQL